MEMKVLFCHLESKSKEEARSKKEERRIPNDCVYPERSGTLSGVEGRINSVEVS